MINSSIPLSAPIELINITPFNPLISKCQIKVCWVGNEPNPNNSVITKEAAIKLADSIPGSPIVGYYNEETEDFESHNKIIEIRNGKFTLKPTTKPYGFVDIGAKVWFQKFSDNGVEREYMVTEGWLWTGQFPECKRVVEKGNNQSMELDQNLIDAYWTKDVNGKNEFFIINEAIMSKLCILGEDVRPAFEGANITSPKIEFSFDEDFKNKMFSMMEEIKNIVKEGGASGMENEKKEQNCSECGKPISECKCKKDEIATPEDNNPTENAMKEICADCGKPKTECACGDKKKDEFACGDKKKEFACGKKKEFGCDKCEEKETCEKEEKELVKEDLADKKENACGGKTKYELEEIPEYVELKTSYDTLKNEFSALEATVNELKEFKAGVEKIEKENMIKQFSMLSDEDKKDVVDHINEYSLDEIEAKLSVICVRNKVNFNTEATKDEPIVYNLNETDNTPTEDTPSWLNAVISVAKNM